MGHSKEHVNCRLEQISSQRGGAKPDTWLARAQEKWHGSAERSLSALSALAMSRLAPDVKAKLTATVAALQQEHKQQRARVAPADMHMQVKQRQHV